MGLTWANQQQDLAVTMSVLGHRQFIVVQYLAGLDPNPYAQAAPEPDGTWYCEVVSAHYLPGEVWPLDERHLLSREWEAPERAGENWACAVGTSDEAAARLIDALARGRVCGNPTLLACEIGRWPSDPDGGEDASPWYPEGPLALAA